MMPLCIRCRGKGLCGRTCPIIGRNKVYQEQIKNLKENFSGSAPSVFVGHYGYPNINVGILSPPEIDEEAWKLDAPEFWYDNKYGVDDILSLRSRMVHSRNTAKVKVIEGKLIETAQEIAMARRPVDTEFVIKGIPKPTFSLDTRVAPIGAPTELIKVTPGNISISHKVEKIVNDELRASIAINELYSSGIDTSQITKILSVGLLGSEKKLVPTRWSITATDDTISKNLLKNIREYKEIGEYFVFYNDYIGNHYEILMIPREWSFEVIEAKLPGSCWNLQGSKIYFYNDYEKFEDRKQYAYNVAGGYYAARIAVTEYLEKTKKQASVLVFREVRPEYLVPLGVWQCRENVRGALEKKPEKFATLEAALKRIGQRLELSRLFEDKSALLREMKVQRRLCDF
jgi:hypothetical protein